MTPVEKLKERIRNLIAKAQGTDNEHEAETFMAKAMELMEKHQFAIYDLDTDDPMTNQESSIQGDSGPQMYRGKVLCSLAAYYGASVVRDHKRVDTNKTGWQGRWNVLGRESAVITTEVMAEFCWVQINKAANEIAKDSTRNRGQCQRDVANAFCHRVWRLVREAQKKRPKVAPNGRNSLVMVDELEEFKLMHYPNLRSSRTGRGTRTTAAARDAAGKISLNKQAGGARQLKLA